MSHGVSAFEVKPHRRLMEAYTGEKATQNARQVASAIALLRNEGSFTVYSRFTTALDRESLPRGNA